MIFLNNWLVNEIPEYDLREMEDVENNIVVLL
jgi:hypothetical protein